MDTQCGHPLHTGVPGDAPPKPEPPWQTLCLLVACLSSSSLPRPWCPSATVLTFSEHTGFCRVPTVYRHWGYREAKHVNHIDKCPVIKYDKGNVQGAPTALNSCRRGRKAPEEVSWGLKPKDEGLTRSGLREAGCLWVSHTRRAWNLAGDRLIPFPHLPGVDL